MAFEAEQTGWDGFLVWEPIWGYDAWMLLTAAAMRTERSHLGKLLTLYWVTQTITPSMRDDFDNRWHGAALQSGERAL